MHYLIDGQPVYCPYAANLLPPGFVAGKPKTGSTTAITLSPVTERHAISSPSKP